VGRVECRLQFASGEEGLATAKRQGEIGGYDNDAAPLETRDHHIGGKWQHEFYAALLVGLHGGGQVELGQGNVLCPVAVLPVVAAHVDHTVRDVIVRDLLAMAVAIHERRGRELFDL